jgi:hypothetical protein
MIVKVLKSQECINAALKRRSSTETHASVLNPAPCAAA